MSNITLDQLRDALSPKAFNVIGPVFSNIAERLQETENRLAQLQSEQTTTNQLAASFRDAVSQMTLPTAAPPPPVAQPQAQVARAPLHTELPIFRGRPDDNVSAFISIAKDLLRATHIDQEDWGVIVSGCLRDAAQTWYLAKKQANNDQPLPWNELEQELRRQFDHPHQQN